MSLHERRDGREMSLNFAIGGMENMRLQIKTVEGKRLKARVLIKKVKWEKYVKFLRCKAKQNQGM